MSELEKLKKAVRDANEALLGGEGIELWYYMEFNESDKESVEILKQVVGDK